MNVPADQAESEQPAEPTPTYEQARDGLAEIVRRLEAGGTTLEESLLLWERGEHLAEVAQAWLDGARQRIDSARARATGEQAG